MTLKQFGRDFRIVFFKELRELFRDRRSLFWLFAPPIILPGIAICAALFIGSQIIRIADEGVPVTFENAAAAPDLVDHFDEADATYVVDPPENPEEDAFGEALAIIVIPEDFQEILADGGTAQVQIVTKDSSVLTFFASSAVRSVLDDYRDDILQARLAELDLTDDWLEPIRIDEGRRATQESVASEDEGGGSNIVATIFLPLAVTSWLLGGGMGLILDTTVGEKERQTIENLLVTPANRMSIVMGKMTVVFIASMMVMSLWLTEGLLLNGVSNAGTDLVSSSMSGPEVLQLLVESSGSALGLVLALLVMIIPFTIMLNGLVMAWCAYAANYREANLFMALVQLGLPATVLLTIFSLPPEVVEVVYAVPLFGTIVAIRDLFSGTLSMSALLINFGSAAVYATGALALAAWVFGREWSLTRGLQ